jgi:hypothetical protein
VGIGSQLDQGLGSGFDQDTTEFFLSATQNGAEFLGHGKDHVKVFDRQQFGLALLQPHLSLLMMALGATAVAARVIGIVHPSTVIALKGMAAHPFRTTSNDIMHGPTMAGKHIGTVLRSVRTTVAYENIRQFRHGRSPDDVTGIRERPSVD